MSPTVLGQTSGSEKADNITSQAPRFDAEGKKIDEARMSVVHNGVTIHDNLAVPRPTTAALDNNVKEPGGVCLQDHGNEVQYRNIWLVELPLASGEAYGGAEPEPTSPEDRRQRNKNLTSDFPIGEY